MFDLLFIFVL